MAFKLGRACDLYYKAVFLLFWGRCGVLSVFRSIVLGAIICIGILLALRGLTVKEIKAFMRLQELPIK